MLTRLLRLKPWQMFALIAAPYVSNYSSAFFFGGGFFGFGGLISLVGALAYLAWVYAIAWHATQRVPESVNLPWRRFQVVFGLQALNSLWFVFFLIGQVVALAAGVDLSELIDSLFGRMDWVEFAPYYASVGFFGLAAYLHSAWYCSKAIRAAEGLYREEGASAGAEFWSIVFASIGVWTLQKRLQRLLLLPTRE